MNCIVCGSSELKTTLANIKNPRTIGANEYSYLECNQCHLWMLDPMPSIDELKKIYTQEYTLYENPSQSITSKIMDTIAESREQLIARLKPSGTILDVGCGNGTFLQQMQQSGYDVHGTEWSSAAAAEAKQKLSNDQITIGDIENVEGTFNIITLWHVLEHNTDPLVLLQKIKARLKPNGYLCIEVPNSASAVLQKTQQQYPWFSIPEHVTYWNNQALSSLAKKSNFSVIESNTPFSMPFLYAKARPGIAAKAISPFLQFYASLTQKGDIIRQVWKSL